MTPPWSGSTSQGRFSARAIALSYAKSREVGFSECGNLSRSQLTKIPFYQELSSRKACPQI